MDGVEKWVSVDEPELHSLVDVTGAEDSPPMSFVSVERLKFEVPLGIASVLCPFAMGEEREKRRGTVRRLFVIRNS